MTDMFVPGVGAVFSADIAVPEHDRELRFYSRVLTTGEDPFWREDLMNNLGQPVIGLGQRTDAYSTLPLRWMPHIQVADVAASVQRGVELGGSVVMQSNGEDPRTQWAVMLDPFGAAFGLIPVVPEEAIPQEVRSAARVGRIAWMDLTVPDAAAARDFYREVVGWSVRDVEMVDGGEQYADFGMVAEGGRGAAGVCHARGMNLGLPPVWLIYLPVADLAESLRRVEEEGGKIVKTAKGSNGEYVYAAVQDPVGVYFALMPG